MDPVEQQLLAQLAQCENDWLEAQFYLGDYYRGNFRVDLAVDIFNRLLSATNDTRKQSDYFVELGLCMEKKKDFQTDVDYYARGLALGNCRPPTHYWLHNNTGYCLNQLERYQEAEPFCRAAIEIDPSRHNAYKNLGLAQAGLRQIKEAACSFLLAVQKNAADPRALRHLEELAVRHSELPSLLPDLQDRMEECRKAVTMARKLLAAREIENRCGLPNRLVH